MSELETPSTPSMDESELRRGLERLIVAQDGDEYIIGRADRDLYVAVPEPGAVLVEALRDGASLGEATDLASKAAGEDVDAVDFLTGLRDAGMFARDDDPDVSPGSEVGRGVRIGWIDRVPQRAARMLFGRVAWSLYGLATLTVIALWMVRPDLWPIFDDLWFLDDPIWSMLAMFVVSVVLAGVHEVWHWLAGRALGVPARFRMSKRGVALVFESDLSQLVTLPRRARYSPMLAGIAFDLSVLALAFGTRLAFREELLNVPPLIDRFAGALVFRQVLVLAWQFFGVAFRSDSYAILANALGCHNLYRATALTLKDRVWRLSDVEATELAAIGPRDRKVAGWFWVGYLAGGFLMLVVMVRYIVPLTFGMIAFLTPNITGLATETVAFWQSLAVVVLLVGQFAVVPLIGARERRHRRRNRPATAGRTARPVVGWHVWVTRVSVAVVAILAANYGIEGVLKFVEASPDASAENAAAAAHDDSCLPGDRVDILDYPHISQQDAATVEYNSNPATSGAHYGMAVAPGIYRSTLEEPQLVHSLEHGRVAIQYLPDTPSDIVGELESIAKQYAPHVVMAPNPRLDTQIALTAWGRIDTFDEYDEERITRFVGLLHSRYDHHDQAGDDECADHDHD